MVVTEGDKVGVGELVYTRVGGGFMEPAIGRAAAAKVSRYWMYNLPHNA